MCRFIFPGWHHFWFSVLQSKKAYQGLGKVYSFCPHSFQKYVTLVLIEQALPAFPMLQVMKAGQGHENEAWEI